MKTRFATMFSLLALAAPMGAQPQTRYATSPDGKRIAFDVTGPVNAPAIMLLHGGGQSRRDWHAIGYVDSLARMHRVITVDARGHGESDKPTNEADYEISRLTADLLAVADSAGARTFVLWGFSYGANIGRYLASGSDRVRSMIYVGIPFGPAADSVFASRIRQIQQAPTPNTTPVTLAWLGALLKYPAIEPRDMRSPTLWLVGTQNTGAMASVRHYESRLAGTRVTLQLLEGLNHPQEITSLPVVLPRAVAFINANR